MYAGGTPYPNAHLPKNVAPPFLNSVKNMAKMDMDMDQVSEQLIEEVRKYRHLYDSSSAEYEDYQMAANSWERFPPTLCHR